MARKKISMSSLVRKSLAKGITKPSEVVAHIQKEHGVTVKVGLVHNVKSMEAKKKPSKPSRKPGPKTKTAVASSNGRAGTLTMQDITTVKGLLSRLGKSDLQELISVLA
jgi:hypothetical protein